MMTHSYGEAVTHLPSTYRSFPQWEIIAFVTDVAHHHRNVTEECVFSFQGPLPDVVWLAYSITAQIVKCVGLVGLLGKPDRSTFGTIFQSRRKIYLLDIYMRNGYNETMIKSFADKETEKVYNQLFSKKLPQSIQKIALRKLIMIDNAGCLEDLRVPPANQLELLKGDRAGQYSIRINGQYRVCFNVDGNSFFNVEIVDYH